MALLGLLVMIASLIGVSYTFISPFRTVIHDLPNHFFGRQVSDVVFADGYVEFTISFDMPSTLSYAYFWIEDGRPSNKKCPTILDDEDYPHKTYRVRTKCHIENEDQFKIRTAWLKFGSDTTMLNWAWERPRAEMKPFEPFTADDNR